MTTGERRAVVQRVEAQYAVSERYACRALGFERSVMRSVPQRPMVDAPLREQIVALAAEHPRWGVRRRTRKRLAVPRVPRPVAVGPHETWSLDCVSDQLSDGRRFRCLTVIDSCTRECLTISVAHSLPSTAVITALESVIATRGRPTRLSLDNGAAFRSRTFDAWAADRGIALQFIQPGKPVQHAHVESFNGKFRDECLNQHWFLSLLDAQFHIERYRRDFNIARPHEACHPLTPHEYAQTFTAPSPARLSA